MRLAHKSVEADGRRPMVVYQPLRVAADRRVRALGAKRRENERDDLVAIIVRLRKGGESEVVYASDQSVLAAIGAMRARIVSLEYLEATEEAVVGVEKPDEVRTVQPDDVLQNVIVGRPVEAMLHDVAAVGRSILEAEGNSVRPCAD